MERPLNSFPLIGEELIVTQEMKQYFQQDGYVVIRNLLDKEELSILKSYLENDPNREKYSFQRDDGKGKKNTYLAWNHPGSDVTGMIARSEKVAGTFGKLLGGEVYHYHSKLIQKDAKSGGAFNWHQDYGYWYENGCLYPDMGTVYIAVDKADKSNGCLTIIPGSHRLGRVDHVPVGEEMGADPVRVDQARKALGVTYAELDAGSAIFFHSNILHSSNQNLSNNRRWGFLVAYNLASNNPYKDHHHPRYTKLEKVVNSAIKLCKADVEGKEKDFMQDTKSEIGALLKR